MPAKTKKEPKHKACSPYEPAYLKKWREDLGLTPPAKHNKEENSDDDAPAEEAETEDDEEKD